MLAILHMAHVSPLVVFTIKESYKLFICLLFTATTKYVTASNANFTVNLLHSLSGVDYYNILDGPSNGFELLHFFEDTVEIQRPDGSVLLERGDCVVMDNCGFHHCLFVEPVLRELSNDYGVQLIYQPPYCPHLNTCEYCFHQLKEFLRRCHIQFKADRQQMIVVAKNISACVATVHQ